MQQRRVFQASDPVGLAAWLLPELIAAAARRDIPEHQLLHGSRIFAADLQFSQSRISYHDWWLICHNASRTASPELAWICGQAMASQAHPFAKLLHTAPNKGLALRWLVRFRRQYFPFVYPKLHRMRSAWQLSLQPLPGQALDAGHRFALEVALAFCLQLLDDPRISVTGRAELAPYWRGALTHHAHSYSLLCPDAVLQHHSEQAFAAEYQHQRRICLQQALVLPAGISAPEQLYRVLARALPALPNLAQCAQQLGVSTSGLKRQLADFNCNFSRLQDKVREDAAVNLLGKEQSNRQLAQALGFSDEHNFRRAFKRWTGLLPSAFRL